MNSIINDENKKGFEYQQLHIKIEEYQNRLTRLNEEI